VRGAYCVWHGVAGGHGFRWVGKKALDAVKRQKEKQGKSVWGTDPIAMALKTTIARESKLWKRTRRMALAGALDDAEAADLPQPALVPANDSQADAPPKLDGFVDDPAPWDEEKSLP
jgi:hypothetical protein